MASIDSKPQILMQNALVRARMCEGLAKLKQLPDPDSFFTVGLFSMLDSLMDASMESIVKPLPLSAEIVDALIDRSGGAGAALNCVCAYEACRWADVNFLDVPREEIGKVYLESFAWALDASSGL
mgnify:CR=1 FL=1